MSTSVIPIIIVSFNRLEVLKVAIASYAQLPSHQIIIHDTGSSYEPLLNYYRELESEGVIVLRDRKKIKRPDDLNSVDETVQNWLCSYPDTEYFIVTDPDIELMDGCSELFEFYSFIISEYDVPVVGPMLRIDDLPNAYPLKNRVIEGHTQNYWDKVAISVSWNSTTVDVQRAIIDTTFGMYPANKPFQRRQYGMRTRKPFIARHLDWYIDPNNMTIDQKLYMESASNVSHWGGPWLAKNIISGWIPK